MGPSESSSPSSGVLLPVDFEVLLPVVFEPVLPRVLDSGTMSSSQSSCVRLADGLPSATSAVALFPFRLGFENQVTDDRGAEMSGLPVEFYFFIRGQVNDERDQKVRMLVVCFVGSMGTWPTSSARSSRSSLKRAKESIMPISSIVRSHCNPTQSA